MLTGSISFVASLTIIISILRSDVKLSTSYRRLVFGISVFDLLQSLSQAFSSTPMPVGTSLLSFGNDTTCAIQSFVHVIGFTGTIFYSLSLTIYFLLVVKYRVGDAKISKYVEPHLHSVPIIFSSAITIFLLATKSYNADDAVGVCMINSRPLNCFDDPDVDCISKGNPKNFIRSLALSLLTIFILNCIMMAMIWFEVHFTTRRSQAYRYSWMLSSRTPDGGRINQEQEDGDTSVIGTPCVRATWQSHFGCISSFFSSKHPTRNREETEPALSPLAARLSRPSQASIRRMKDASNRALGYVAAFLLTYSFTFIHRVMLINTSTQIPFAITFLARFFYPLQGFFNVLIYTYPHVVCYRRNHSECSWFRAFREVVKSGGDSDRNRLSSGRRRSLGRQRQALATKNPMKNKNKNRERRNSSLNYENDIPSAAFQLVSPAIEMSIQREKTSSREHSDTPKPPPMDVYSACEEGSEEGLGDLSPGSSTTKNDLFPVASPTLMKLDSNNWAISSDNRDDDSDDDGSYNGLSLRFPETEDFGDLGTDRRLDNLY